MLDDDDDELEALEASLPREPVETGAAVVYEPDPEPVAEVVAFPAPAEAVGTAAPLEDPPGPTTTTELVADAVAFAPPELPPTTLRLTLETAAEGDSEPIGTDAEPEEMETGGTIAVAEVAEMTAEVVALFLPGTGTVALALALATGGRSLTETVGIASDAEPGSETETGMLVAVGPPVTRPVNVEVGTSTVEDEESVAVGKGGMTIVAFPPA